MLICKVCQQGRVIQGYWLCEACRSFLRRNRSNHKMACVTGLRQCLKWTINCVANGKVAKTFQNSKQRNMCKGCRLEKCLQLQAKNCLKKQNIRLIRTNTTEFEHIFHKIVNASTQFQRNLQQFRVGNGVVSHNSQFHNGCVVLKKYLDSLRDQISMMKKFAKGFPIFSNMNLHDRVAFFCSTQFRAIVGEGLINDDNFHFGCFSGQNWPTLRPLFPSPLAELFESINSQSHRIWQSIRSFNWSIEEKYFFLVFLFFYS